MVREEDSLPTIRQQVLGMILEKATSQPTIPLSLTTRIGDLGIDSLAVLDLILGIEEATGCEFEDEDLVVDYFETVGDVLELVERRFR